MLSKFVSSLTHFYIKGLICDKNSIESLLISQKDVIVMLVFVCLSVSLHVIMYLCVSSPISHHNFVKWDPIVTTLYMEIPGYSMWFLEKYLEHRDMSKVKVRVTKNMKCTDWAVTFEPDVIETSGWLHFSPYWQSHFVTQSQQFWHNILQNKSNNINVWHRPRSKFVPVLTRT